MIIVLVLTLFPGDTIYPAGTFLLNIPATVGRDTLVRVNMFGGRLIKLLKRVQVANANWVFVKGELMVRDKKDDGSGRDVRLEVRGQKLFFDLAADANDSSEEEES